MSFSLKFAEVLIILAAGVAFFYWQFRDLKKSREETQKQVQSHETTPLDSNHNAKTAHTPGTNDGR